jgi:hypothetical protein
MLASLRQPRPAVSVPRTTACEGRPAERASTKPTLEVKNDAPPGTSAPGRYLVVVQLRLASG